MIEWWWKRNVRAGYKGVCQVMLIFRWPFKESIECVGEQWVVDEKMMSEMNEMLFPLWTFA